jgi:hypothetical protein
MVLIQRRTTPVAEAHLDDRKARRRSGFHTVTFSAVGLAWPTRKFVPRSICQRRVRRTHLPCAEFAACRMQAVDGRSMSTQQGRFDFVPDRRFAHQHRRIVDQFFRRYNFGLKGL